MPVPDLPDFGGLGESIQQRADEVVCISGGMRGMDQIKVHMREQGGSAR
jgi:hypothetical protein